MTEGADTAITPDEAGSTAPPQSGSIGNRVAEIESVRDADIGKYFEQGLDRELLELERDSAGEQDNGLEEDTAEEDAGDGKPETAADGDAAGEAAEDEPEGQDWVRPDDPYAAAAWRELRGIPADPTDYDLAPEGQELTDAGRETLEAYAQIAHELDLPQATARQLAEFVAEQGQRQREAIATRDKADVEAGVSALRGEFGDDYTPNMELARAGMKALPEAFAKELRGARLGNGQGRKLINDPQFVGLLMEIGRLKKITPSDEMRLKEIESVRDRNIDEYRNKKLDQEALALNRKIAADKNAVDSDAPALSPAEEQEERELLELLEADVDKYNRQWRGTGKTGSERLLELQRAKAKGFS